MTWPRSPMLILNILHFFKFNATSASYNRVILVKNGWFVRFSFEKVWKCCLKQKRKTVIGLLFAGHPFLLKTSLWCFPIQKASPWQRESRSGTWKWLFANILRQVLLFNLLSSHPTIKILLLPLKGLYTRSWKLLRANTGWSQRSTFDSWRKCKNIFLSPTQVESVLRSSSGMIQKCPWGICHLSRASSIPWRRLCLVCTRFNWSVSDVF